MKKGITLVTISVILVITATGCKKKEDNVSDEFSVQSEKPKVNESDIEEEKVQSSANEKEKQVESPNKSAFTIQEVVYQEGEIEIRYPQIKGLTDPAMETKWNELLKNHSLAGVDEWWNKEDYYNLTYKIGTQTAELLSIVFYGSYYAEGAAHPNSYITTYNIDLKTGKLIRLVDHADVEQIATNLMNGVGYQLKYDIDEQFQQQLHTFFQSKDKLAASLAEYDYNEENWYATVGFSYRMNEKTILCMEVTHALGDYLEIELE